MHNVHSHDHTQVTHSVKCDGCEYIAKTHSHDEVGAVNALSFDLAVHNKGAHNRQTDPEKIKDAV